MLRLSALRAHEGAATLEPPVRTAPSPPRARRPRRLRALTTRPELLALLVLAAFLHLWGLGQNGLANEYYSAAVRSMSGSWHAFLHGSFDAAGIMTVDKPPLALWVQALSARVFGFSSLSLLVPQALMGVAAVGLSYDVVRRRFGRAAGATAGLVLALTPVSAAIARHNNPDMLLVLCCVAAVWFLVRGLEDGRTRWLVLSGVAVGLGFEAKMAAALLVVPALAAAWLHVAPRGRLAAVRQLVAGGAAMTAVGLAWPVLVWLTPAADRPWVSGTSDNSIWSLILGYNGLGRLFGQDGGPGGGAGAGGGLGAVFGGDPGLGRLLDESLGGQAGWLLGVAAVAGLGLVAVTLLRRSDPRTGWLVAVGGSALTMAVAFSRAEGIFHPYYVSQLAPFVAMLAGAGVGTVLRDRATANLLGPALVAAGVVVELAVLADHPGQLAWLPAVLVVGGMLLAVALAVVGSARLRAVLVAAAMALLLVAPGTWAVQTLGHATSGTFPAGGPASAATMGGGGGGFGGGGGAVGAGPFAGTTDALSEAVAYAAAHRGGTVAVASQSGAAGVLLADGADVAALGGFSGRESQVSVAWLADAVEDGRVRWVLTTSDGSGGPADGRVGASDVLAVAAEVGEEVEGVDGLVDLRGTADALRSL